MEYQYMILNKEEEIVILYNSYFNMATAEVLINLSYEGYNINDLTVIPVNDENKILLKNTQNYDIIYC